MAKIGPQVFVKAFAAINKYVRGKEMKKIIGKALLVIAGLSIVSGGIINDLSIFYKSIDSLPFVKFSPVLNIFGILCIFGFLLVNKQRPNADIAI
jgi:hypothetical protein